MESTSTLPTSKVNKVGLAVLATTTSMSTLLAAVFTRKRWF